MFFQAPKITSRPAAPMHLIYLHGFRSSSQSFKAQQLKEALPDIQQYCDFELQLHLPDLPVEPNACIKQMERLILSLPEGSRVGLIGSSLGGYYAAYLAKRFSCRCVLINPAVKAYELLTKHTGVNTNYHTGVEEEFREEYIAQLKRMETKPNLEDVLLLVQTQDETLDYNKAVKFFQGCHQYVGLGGSHSFEFFEDFFQMIMRFFVR